MRAIEIGGTVDDKRQIHLDNPLPIDASRRVRVIVLFADESDEWNQKEWLKAAASNTAFDFLADAVEDRYTLKDGKPFQPDSI